MRRERPDRLSWGARLHLAIAIERGIVLSLAGRGASSIDRAVGRFAADGDPDRLAAALRVVETSSTRVLLATLAALPHGPGTVDDEMTSALIQERGRLDRGLAILGTTGSNAPFIGLLGVLGIVRAFHELAANTSAGNSAVMAGISESLVSTAVGLFGAIPAVVLYNMLQRRVKTVLSHAEAAAHRRSIAVKIVGPSCVGTWWLRYSAAQALARLKASGYLPPT